VDRMNPNPVVHGYKAGHLCQVVSRDSSDEDSLSGGESGKSDDPDNVQLSSSGYIETHSDSEADAERSGDEDGAKKGKKKVLKRRKGQQKPIDDFPIGQDELERNQSVADDVVEIHEIPVQNISEEPRPQEESERNKIGMCSGSGNSVPEQLEPSAVMTELSNLVNMADSSSIIQEFVPNLLEGSDGGSYSSRMSTKSEKNMADFDGEESIGDDELMRTLAQNQLVELAVRNPVSNACNTEFSRYYYLLSL